MDLLRRVATENGGLDSSTEGDSLIGVDGLVWLLAIGEKSLTSFWMREIRVAPPTSPCRSSSPEHLFYRFNSRTEEVLVQLLETNTGDEGVMKA